MFNYVEKHPANFMDCIYSMPVAFRETKGNGLRHISAVYTEQVVL